jgi:peptide/nickel transport system permease protein
MSVILLFVSFGTFIVARLVPGDPAIAVLGVGATPDMVRKYRHEFGLDQNLLVQFWAWLSHVLRGDFGMSIVHQGVTVGSIIKTAAPVDFELIILSQLLAIALAIPTALKASRRPNRLFDRLSNISSFVVWSIPSYVIIIFLLDLVSVQWNVAHTGPGSYVNFSLTNWSAASTNLLSMLIPVFTLAVGSFVSYFRVLRSELIGTLQEDFVTMARSKGMSTRRVMWRHALRPSSVAFVMTAGINVGSLVAGGFVVQFMMQMPGLGYNLVNSITEQDYPVLQGISFVVAVSIVIVTFLADFIAGLLDPRIINGRR